MRGLEGMVKTDPLQKSMPPVETDIIIVGAGIAGLAAGCYAQMNGYRSQIFEKNANPGGLCTASHQQGYTFDGCIHYLFGTGTGQPFHQIWQELGATQGLAFIYQDEFMRIVGSQGETLVVYSNPDRLESHLKTLSPADAPLIESFCAGVRRFTEFDLSWLQQKPKSLMTGADWARLGRRLLPFAKPMAKWGSLPIREFAQRFRSPFLRRAIAQLISWPDVPTMVAMSMLAYQHNGNVGSPLGGSLNFARAIEQRYHQLGGQIHYGVPVENVLVEADRAVGVKLNTGESYQSDRVISASDGRYTLYHLLEGRYLNRALEKLYGDRTPTQSQVQVSMGINRDFSNQPHWTTYLLDQPIAIAGASHAEFSVKHYCFDPALAPPGKSVVTLLLSANYSRWQGKAMGGLLDPSPDHPAIAPLINQFTQLYPDIRDDIECVEITTPLDYEQTTGNWQGSICGWALNKDTLPLLIKGIPKTLPNLQGFYMAGQWVEPGGSLPIVAMSGRNAIQQICDADQRTFVSAIP